MEHKLSIQNKSIKLPKQQFSKTFKLPPKQEGDVNFDKVYYQNMILKTEINPIQAKESKINFGSYDALNIIKK